MCSREHKEEEQSCAEGHHKRPQTPPRVAGTISRIWINRRRFLKKYSKPLQHQRLKWEAGHKQPTSKVENLNKRCNKIKMSPTQLEQECRVIIESDEEIDQGFSYLLEEKGTDVGNYSMEVAKENTERILRKARRRKRKYCNTITIN